VNRKTEHRKQETEFTSRGIRARARIPEKGPELPNFPITGRPNFSLHVISGGIPRILFSEFPPLSAPGINLFECRYVSCRVADVHE
jgi:hypothetical protein